MARPEQSLTVVMVVAALTLASCGGGGGGSTPTTLPPAPQTTVVSQGGGTLDVDEIGTVTFTTSATGRIDITVDWTFATNDIDLALFNRACSPLDVILLLCGAPIAVADSLAKPERLSVSNAAAGAYTLGIENLGPGAESLAFQVTLTR